MKKTITALPLFMLFILMSCGAGGSKVDSQTSFNSDYSDNLNNEPYIGDNGNWWIGNVDTGLPAKTEDNTISAYENYLLNHPNYGKSEDEWRNDLFSGAFGTRQIHKVTFDSKGYCNIPSQYVLHGEKIIEPNNYNNDIVISSWTYLNTKWVFLGYSCTCDMVLVADLSNNTYQVTLDYNIPGSDLSFTICVALLEEYDFGTPVRDGYKFDYWESTNSKFESKGVWKLTHNELLYAHWTPITYSIVLCSEDLVYNNKSINITYNDNYELPLPNKTGFRFCYWQTDKGEEVQRKGIWKYTNVTKLTSVFEKEIHSPFLPNKIFKSTYHGLIYFNDAVPNLNYMETSETADARHFANFVDGLIVADEFGQLKKNLAIEAKHNDDYTRFEFKIRRNVPWVTYDGAQYEAVVNGIKTKQYVQPSDWVTSAKAILTAQNASPLEYFISDFVKGGAEYLYYTDLMYKIATDNTFRKKYDGKPDAQAKYINDQIKALKENAWNSWYAENPVTGDDLEGIKNLSRLGIKANDEEGTLSYELIQKAFYFPTLLTYSCYLPVNQYFLATVRFAGFGVTNDKILYNGPYLFSKEGDNQLIYNKNKSYYDQSIISLNQIVYSVYDNSIGNDYTRTQYFKGNIDGFSLNSRDTVGWSQFVTGPDGSGTIRDPYSGDVNSRLLDTISDIHGSNISLARTKDAGSKISYCSKGSPESVANTEKALQLEPVRRAILNALDYDAYYCNYSTEEPLKSQYKVNTHTPKNFVQSESGDYVTNHYYNVYAAKKGIPTGTSVGNGAHMEDGELVAEEGSAAYILENGRIDRCQKSNAEVAALAAEAKKAIEAYNAGPGSADPISLPVYVEFYTLWDVDTTGNAKTYDGQTILSMNKRLNNTDSESVADYDLFYVIPTDKITSANSDALSHTGAFDYAPVLWGWGADYGDPLTYANTYCIGGDWKSIFPYVGMEQVDNYFWDYENHTLGEKTNLLREYTDMVKAAAAITDDINARYNKFAECEYMLMEELSIYMPQINSGQTWSLSIGKTFNLHTSSFGFGLSKFRLNKLMVAESTITRSEIKTAQKNKQNSRPTDFNLYDIY